MDPNTGRLFPSIDAAFKAGVENPVEITGKPEDVQRISDAVGRAYTAEQRARKRAKNKAARAARKAARR